MRGAEHTLWLKMGSAHGVMAAAWELVAQRLHTQRKSAACTCPPWAPPGTVRHAARARACRTTALRRAAARCGALRYSARLVIERAVFAATVRAAASAVRIGGVPCAERAKLQVELGVQGLATLFERRNLTRQCGRHAGGRGGRGGRAARARGGEGGGGGWVGGEWAVCRRHRLSPRPASKRALNGRGT